MNWKWLVILTVSSKNIVPVFQENCELICWPFRQTQAQSGYDNFNAILPRYFW
jgi:hypothetical protein